MMKDRLNSLYDKIAPIRDDDEIIRAVIGKAENMDTNSKKRTTKRPVLIACAATLTLALGVTAAATGLIDFAELFGGRLAVADNERASVLLAEVSGQHIEISNDDYNVELKGVVGDDTAVIGRIEITRKDGKPVADDFLNEPAAGFVTDWFSGFEISQLFPTEHYVNVLNCNNAWGSARSMGIVVNDSGNLDIYFDIFSSSDDADGNKIVIMLKNLFTVYEDGTKKPVFPEELWVDFTYLPTEQALAEKLLLVPNEVMPAFMFAGETSEPSMAYCNFGSISAHIKVEYEHSIGHMIATDAAPDIKLIDADGNIIANTGFKIVGSDHEGNFMEYELCYYNEDGVRTAVNIEDVVKVRINGTDYDL